MARTMVLTDPGMQTTAGLPWAGYGGSITINQIMGLGLNHWLIYYTGYTNADSQTTPYGVIQEVFAGSDGTLTYKDPWWFNMWTDAPPPPPNTGNAWSSWFMDADGHIVLTDTFNDAAFETGTFDFSSQTVTWGTPVAKGSLNAYQMFSSGAWNGPQSAFLNWNTLVLWNSADTTAGSWQAGDLIIGKIDPRTGGACSPVLVGNNPDHPNQFAFGMEQISDRYAVGWAESSTGAVLWTYLYDYDPSLSSPVSQQQTGTSVPAGLTYEDTTVALAYSSGPASWTPFVIDKSSMTVTESASPLTTREQIPIGAGGATPFRSPKAWDTSQGEIGRYALLTYDASGTEATAVHLQKVHSDSTNTAYSDLTVNYTPSPLWLPSDYDPTGTNWNYTLQTWGNDGFGTYLFSFTRDTTFSNGNVLSSAPYLWAGAGTGAPPTRQYPRDDNLALGSVRQGGRSTSLQNSGRQGWRGTYS